MKCKNCGTALSSDFGFCPRCGAPIKAPAAKKSKKKIIFISIAVLILVGIIGNLMSEINSEPVHKVSKVYDGAKNTIMMYLDGTDIESGEGRAVQACMTSNIRQALSSGIDTENNNVLIYTGGCDKWHDFNIPSDKDCIYIIKDENLVLLEERSSHNMADPDTLEYFLSYCVENYPAESYSLLLSDHGGGPNIGLCTDINTGDIMDLSELSSALTAVGFVDDCKLETIIYDACLMASVEVAAKSKKHANYMIASENPSISSGGDYSFLAAFNTAESGKDIGVAYVDSFYKQSINEGKRLGVTSIIDITFSCIDLSKIDNVIEKSDVFFNSATKDMDEMYFSFSLAREYSKSVYDPGGDPNVSTQFYYDLIDLYDFISKQDNSYREEAQALIDALDEAIVYNRSNSNKMNGLTFYSPFKSELDSDYSKVCFSDSYSNYISAFIDKREGRKSSFHGFFSSVAPMVTSSATDSFNVSMVLTEEQVKDFSYGEYYIFCKPRNITNKDGSPYTLADDEYSFVTNGFEVNLKGTTLEAEISDKGCYVSSSEGDLLCPLYRMKDDGKIINYTTVGLTYVPDYKEGNDEDDLDSLLYAVENMKLDVGRLYLDITNDKVKVGPLYLISDSDVYQRSPLSTDDYNEVSFDTFVKKTVYDESSNLLPFNEWKTDSSKQLTHSHKTSDLSMKMKSLDENAEYYVMLVAHDVYGTKYCSEIIPLR